VFDAAGAGGSGLVFAVSSSTLTGRRGTSCPAPIAAGRTSSGPRGQLELEGVRLRLAKELPPGFKLPGRQGGEQVISGPVVQSAFGDAAGGCSGVRARGFPSAARAPGGRVREPELGASRKRSGQSAHWVDADAGGDENGFGRRRGVEDLRRRLPEGMTVETAVDAEGFCQTAGAIEAAGERGERAEGAEEDAGREYRAGSATTLRRCGGCRS
jgi:hypothetical protein